MKRMDLKVGDELFHAIPRQWGQHTGDKVVVVATEPYKENRWGRGDSRFSRTGSGSGVLVDLDRGVLGTGREVVQLGHLRGPYGEVATRMAAARDRRRAEVAADEDRRVAARMAAEAVVARAAAAGVKAQVAVGGDLVVLSLTDFADLLDRAEPGPAAG